MQDYSIVRENSPDGKKIVITITVSSPDDCVQALQEAIEWFGSWKPTKKEYPTLKKED